MHKQVSQAQPSDSAQQWIDSLLLSDCEPDERLDEIVRDTARLFKVPIAMINLLTTDTVVFKACVGQQQADCLDRNGSFCDVAVSQDAPLSICDTTKDDRFKNYELVTNDMHIRAYLGKSLHAPDGSRIGTLCLLDTAPRTFSPVHQQALKDLAHAAEEQINLILKHQIPKLTAA